MNGTGLSVGEIGLLRAVLERHPEVSEAKLFGSRAKGTWRPESDIDLALWGEVDELRAERIAAELDELPLPYHFDVKTYQAIRYAPLREHVDRVAVSIFRRAA